MPTSIRDVKKEIYRYKKKSEIMSVISSRHTTYYKKINNFFTALLIVMASFVSILNSVQESAGFNEQYMKFITIGINAIITILISFQRVFKWESKMNEYSKSAVSFNKLGHSINQKIISQDFDMNYLDSLIIVYDNNVEQISEGLKDHIIQQLKEQYKNINAEYLPLCFGILNINNPSISETDGSFSPTGNLRGQFVPNDSFK